jgi:hypothetical protein
MTDEDQVLDAHIVSMSPPSTAYLEPVTLVAQGLSATVNLRE